MRLHAFLSVARAAHFVRLACLIVVRMQMVSVRTKLSFCAHEDGAGNHGCAHEDHEDGGCVRVAFVRTDLTGQDGWLG